MSLIQSFEQLLSWYWYDIYCHHEIVVWSIQSSSNLWKTEQGETCVQAPVALCRRTGGRCLQPLFFQRAERLFGEQKKTHLRNCFLFQPNQKHLTNFFHWKHLFIFSFSWFFQLLCSMFFFFFFFGCQKQYGHCWVISMSLLLQGSGTRGRNQLRPGPVVPSKQSSKFTTWGEALMWFQTLFCSKCG